MNILILGSGGREHTFAHQISQSKNCGNLFVAPGNAGTSKIAENVALSVTDFEAIKALVLKESIEMLIVGPEDPLVHGIQDFFAGDEQLKHITVIGPSKRGALLEGSKERAKQFMAMHNIPTAAYECFTAKSLEAGKSFLETLKPPYVLKADGLAAGKGVLILQDLEEAKEELEKMLAHKKFGEASSKVVIEEFLDGIELSVFVLTDGETSGEQECRVLAQQGRAADLADVDRTVVGDTSAAHQPPRARRCQKTQSRSHGSPRSHRERPETELYS